MLLTSISEKGLDLRHLFPDFLRVRKVDLEVMHHDGESIAQPYDD